MKPFYKDMRTAGRKALCTLVSFVLAFSLMPLAPAQAQASERPVDLAAATIAPDAAEEAAPAAQASRDALAAAIALDAGDEAVWDGTADTSWYSDGSASEYSISTPEQLAGLASIVNGTADGVVQDDFEGKTVKLAASFKLNATAASSSTAQGQRNWTPIGSRTVKGLHNGGQPEFDEPSYFKGTFDGQGNVVRNLFISQVTAVDGATDYGGYQGLFGALGDGAVVENLGIAGGFVAGRVAGAVAALGAPSDAKAAPMILNCYNTATVEGDGSSQRGSGGIFGGELGSESDNGLVYLANCYNAGAVKGKNGNENAPLGGIAGRALAKVYSCYSIGAVDASDREVRGALAGSLAAGSVVADSYGLKRTGDDVLCHVDGEPAGEGLLNQAGIEALVSDGRLSAAFVDGSGAAPRLFWEGAAFATTDLTSTAEVSPVEDQAYTGSPVEPEVTATYSGAALKAGSDYYVTYVNNVDVGRAAAFVVHFIGAYSGTQAGTFAIVASSLNLATVSKVEPQWMYGTDPVVPDIVVKSASGTVLAKGKDYDVEFTDNDREGTATGKVVPHPGGGYKGETGFEFIIAKASDSLRGSGTESDPYLIGNRADMQRLSHDVNVGDGDPTGVYKLEGDIVMNGGGTAPDVSLIGSSRYDEEEGYVTRAFAGTLDGDGHAITMEYDGGGGYYGLFPTNKEGTSVTVRNLKLRGSVKSTSSAAVLFPNVYGNVTLENVSSSVDLTSGYEALGLIGCIYARGNDTVLVGCVNSGTVTGARSAAGLVSELYADADKSHSLTIERCVNRGAVTAGAGAEGAGVRAAGILGKLTQTDFSAEAIEISRCVNEAPVSAKVNAGGLVGVIGDNSASHLSSSALEGNSQVVSSSYNTGAVTAGGTAGGIVGCVLHDDNTSLANVYNMGAVSATGDDGVAGGLVGGTRRGAAWRLSISGSYNAGTVSGSDAGAGAIVGLAGAASAYSPSYGVLTTANVHYRQGSAPTAFGTVEGTVSSGPHVTYPAATLAGDEPRSWTAADMKSAGANGLAAQLGQQFAFDEDAVNGGYPILFWQAGVVETYDIADATVVSVSDVEYTGQAVLPEVTLTYGGATLVQGGDFLVSASGNIEAGEGIELTVTGVGRFTGTLSGCSFNILKADLAGFSIDEIDDQWGGEADPAEPAVTLRNRAGARVVSLSGFTVSYSGNYAASNRQKTARVTVTADDDNANYRNSVSQTFTVRGLPSSLEGQGTEAYPYQISTYRELELFAKRVNAQKPGYPQSFAKLVADISIPAYLELDPIGDGAYSTAVGGYCFFRGTFDGDGHKVTLDYHAPTTYALFNGLSGATVKNLVMSGTTMAAVEESGARAVCGGTFAGVVDAPATFVNCVNEASVVGTAKGVGGFVARTVDGAELTFENCVNEGDVAMRPTDGATAFPYAGGLVGFSFTKGFEGDASITFVNCVNKGSVSNALGSSAGGILGGAAYEYDSSEDFHDELVVTMRGVGNQGDVDAFDGAGGLVGVVSAVDILSIEDAYNTGAVGISNPDGATGQLAGGLVALVSTGGYRSSSALSIANAYNAGAVTCSGQGAASDPALGGILGGMQLDADDASFDNVYFSLDATDGPIGFDRTDGDWSAGISAEYDSTMLDADFAAFLGTSFMADDGENRGFPILKATKADLSGYSAAFREDDALVDAPVVSYNNGNVVCPEVVVKPTALSPDSAALVAGRDYLVFYKNNVNAGTATAVVQGIGSYYGTIELSFTIKGSGSIADCAVAAIPDQAWTGAAIEPALTVTARLGASSTALVEGVDYTVSYANNREAGIAAARIEGTGKWSGSKTVKFNIWKPLITVKVRDSAGNVKVAKRYTRAEFEALVSGGNPVSALYNENEGGSGAARWKVSTAKTYVTFSSLFADAGVNWGSGASVAYNASDAAEKSSSLTYAQLTDRYFYPSTTETAIDMSVARKVEPVLAVEEVSNAIGAATASTAAGVEQYNARFATTGNEPRVITGITRAEALANDARGSRLVKNLDSITVTTSKNPLKASPAKATFTVTQGKAASFAAKDLYKLTNPKGALSYAKASGNAAITIAANGKLAVKSGLAAGSYPVKVRVTSTGDGYEKGTATVSFTVKVLAANTMSVTAKATKTKPAAVSYNAKKDQKIAVSKLFTTSKAQGKVTCKKVSGNSKIAVASSGAVTVKKGLKKGSYPVKLDVTAAGDAKHFPLTKRVTVYVKVK